MYVQGTGADMQMWEKDNTADDHYHNRRSLILMWLCRATNKKWTQILNQKKEEVLVL
jgi:hypothetical protein